MSALALARQSAAESPMRLQAGGTLNPKKHIYIQRPEDEEVLQLLLAGEYVNVLTSRQMGKSSLMTKTAYALQDQGVRFVSIDLAGEIGSQTDAAGYYQGLLKEVVRELELSVDLKTWWQAHELETNNQKLLRFFEDEVGGTIEAPVVIFLDEIESTLKLSFTDDLFTALRTMNNDRTFKEAYQRLTFCLLGVATPNELIKDRRTTPYNVGRTLELRDFDAERDDLTPLALALDPDLETGRALLARVLDWTGGHPYLTNRLCHDLAAAEVQSAEDVDQRVDGMFRTLERVSGDVHIQQILRFVEERFTKELESLDLYARILKGRRERDQPSLAHTELKLSGLVKRDDEGCLMVRNPIYARLFDRAWVGSTTPKRALARARTFGMAASIALALLAGGVAFYQVLVVDPQQRALAVRQELEELQIRIVQSDVSDGLRIEFPKDADQALQEKVSPSGGSRKATQALLEQAAPLILTLPNIVELDAMFTDIDNIEPLKKLTQLEYLGIGSTKISNIESIRNLTKLKIFLMGGHLNVIDSTYNVKYDAPPITDLTPLGNLQNLEEIDLDVTKDLDLTPLRKLEKLRSLRLIMAEDIDTGTIAHMSSLEELLLGATSIEDINFLSRLDRLETLDLRSSKVQSLDALAKLSRLKFLNLAATPVIDFKPIATITTMEELNVSSTAIESVESLRNLRALKKLDLRNTKVADLEPLTGLSKLVELKLDSTEVTDLEPLAKLSKLRELELSHTEVTDLAPLTVLSELSFLNLRGTPLTPEEVRAFRELTIAKDIYIGLLIGPDGGRY